MANWKTEGGRSRRFSDKVISIEKLWERDGGICWLCQDYVDLEEDEATRDHVIPFSRGGTSSKSNLRLAHGECNRIRGNPIVATTAREAISNHRALWPGFNQQV